MPLKRGDEWHSPAQLAEALNYCSGLKELVLGGTRLDDEGMQDLFCGLKSGALPVLTDLDLGGNRCGIAALCEAFGRGIAPNLHILTCPVTCLVTRAPRLLPPRSVFCLPESLKICDLNLNVIGDEGATEACERDPRD